MLDSEEAIFSLEVPLDIKAEGDEFHTQNLSRGDFERRSVIERTESSVNVYCELIEVRHGNLGPDPAASDDLATLLVFRFRFIPKKNGRRVYRAHVRIEFFPSLEAPNAPGLELEAIAPEERWSLMPTKDSESITKGSGLDVGVAGASIVTASGKVSWEKTTSREVMSSTTVTGAMNLGSGRNSGLYSTAVWTLLENESRQTGVPEVRVAALVKRQDSAPFKAVVTLEAKADVTTSFGNFFRRIPLDDPVLFNPGVQPMHPKKGRLYAVTNLGQINLDSLCEARMSAGVYWADENRPE